MSPVFQKQKTREAELIFYILLLIVKHKKRFFSFQLNINVVNAKYKHDFEGNLIRKSHNK